MNKDTCKTCNAEFEIEDLRPYGKEGSLICYDCGTSPENLAATEAAFNKKFDEAAELSNVVILGNPGGPVAFLYDE